MPLNRYDFESIEMSAKRKAQLRTARIEQKFNGPEIETDIGEWWNKVKSDPALIEHLRKQAPDAVKQMEARYGESK